MLGNNAWTIGRFRGVEIRIDPSWSVIAFLVGYSFYVLLSFRFPALAGAERVALALAMTVVFFLGVLVHEIAHAWTALARGIEVHSITLYMFGGATHAELETENPSDELVIAGVGPLTSLAIAAVLWGLSQVLGSNAAGYAAGYLAWINTALAVFNLVPGFPLDGGRVLRSLVWKANNDFVAATRLASRVGHAIGFGIMAVGLFVLLGGNLVNGLWLIAIGWFLAQSAQQSFTQMQVRRLLRGVPARRMMSAGLVDIPGELTLQQAVDDYFMRYDYNAFPVRVDGHPQRIITLSSVRRVPRERWPTTRVDEHATALDDDCTALADEPMDAVLDKLARNEHHRVVVIDDGTVVGIITPRDLARWLERSQALGMTEPLD
ncbi:MAG: site-2 protease family protein [Actinomycetes bacterium]|nr:site-2 protease family protein [Acidimicrobiia bacterium]